MDAPERDARADGADGVEARLVVRVGGVALALPLAAVSRVLSSRPIRTIPHRRGDAILGVVNVDGDLKLCGALGVLCGLPGGGRTNEAGVGSRERARLVVIGSDSRAWVAPVDAVVGVIERAVGDDEVGPLQASRDPSPVVRARFDHDGERVLLLDPEALHASFERRIS